MNNSATSGQKYTNVGNNLVSGTFGVYDFNIKAILKEAWHKTYGIKATYWKAFFLMMLIYLGLFALAFVIAYTIGVIAGLTNTSSATVSYITLVISIVFPIIFIFPIAPLSAGMLMIGVKHCIGDPVQATSIFHYYRYWQRLWVYPFILVIISLLGKMVYPHPLFKILFALISLYAVISYFMFPLLVVEKQLKPWQALEASRKAISFHWFKMLWLLIVLFFISLAGILTLGIAYIWILPMINNTFGILYREMFGANKTIP